MAFFLKKHTTQNKWTKKMKYQIQVTYKTFMSIDVEVLFMMYDEINKSNIHICFSNTGILKSSLVKHSQNSRYNKNTFLKKEQYINTMNMTFYC
jgi:hypothetical protein